MFTVLSGKFKFSAQDSDLDYLCWRRKNSPVSSDLKLPLGKSDKMRYIPKVLGRAKPGQRTNDYNHYDHP